MSLDQIINDFGPYLILGGLGIGLAAMVLAAFVMLGVFVELRRMRQVSEAVGRRLYKMSEPQVRTSHGSSREPIRYAAAALLATRPDRNIDSEAFAREFEDLISDWQQLDSQITDLLDRIDGQDQHYEKGH